MSLTGDLDWDLEVLGAISSTFLGTLATLVSVYWGLEGAAGFGADLTEEALILRIGSDFLGATGWGLASTGFSCFTCGLAVVALTSGFLNSSLMTGFSGTVLDLVVTAAVFEGETDFFFVSDVFVWDFEGDSDFTAAWRLGNDSLGSTLTSALAFGAFLTGLASFLPVDCFLDELAFCALFAGEASALIGVGLTGVFAGFASDCLRGVGLTSDFAGVAFGSAFTAEAFAGVGLAGVGFTGEGSLLAGVYLASDFTADLGLDSDLTADLGFDSDFTADLGFDSDLTAELGLTSALTADLGFAIDSYSDFLAEGFLGDGVEEFFGVGERPRSSTLTSGSSFITASSSICETNPQALIFFGEDLTDLTTTSSLAPDSSSIGDRISFLADCFALCFFADAATLSFLAAEALPES